MSSTPYDDVFHTMIYDCPELIFPMLNEFMGEHYDGTEEIRFFPNEFLMLQPDGEQEKRISDSTFAVISKQMKRYHWECQSTEDKTILIRMFEYDTQIALRTADVKENRLSVYFPNSAVLYLRASKDMPDKLTVEMVTPGGTVSYSITVMNLHMYNLEMIFEKKLYLLLPFYLFLHEKYLKEYETDKQKRGELLAIYEEILSRLEALHKADEINGHTKAMIIIMTKKVTEALAAKQQKVKEGVKKVMGGQIIDHELRQAKRIGIAEGITQGIAEGIRGAIELLKDVNITDEQIKQRIMEKYKLTEEQAEQFMK